MSKISTEMLITLFNDMPNGMVIWEMPGDTDDPRDMILSSANKAALTRSGVPLSNLEGFAIGTIFPGSTTEHLEMLRDAALIGARHPDFEITYAGRWFRVSLIPMGLRHVCAVYVDIDRQKAIEKQSGQLDHDLEQFAYAASHDLQEPLRGVTNYATLLGEEFSGQLGDDGDLYIRYVVDSAKRMGAMIEGLLAFSRVGRNESFKTVSVDQVLDDAIVNLETSIEDHKAAITKDPLPLVYGDSHMLVRLFQNLISNGIKFRDSELPRIHVTASDDGDKWTFSVSDNGIGVNPRFADRVFVIFQRLRKDRPGTGMGLAICKKIVERHGGRIWIESLEGRGATVRFTLGKATSNAGKEREKEALTDGRGQSSGRPDDAQGNGEDNLDARGLCSPRWRGSSPVPKGGSSVLRLEAARPRPFGSQSPTDWWDRGVGGGEWRS